MSRIFATMPRSLTPDNRLTFSRHIDLLVGKIAGKLETFQRVRNSLDNRARRSFYISLIQTSLLYGSNAFSPCLSITHVNRLIPISKRTQRISFGYPPSAHTAPIRARHNLVPLDSLLLFKRLVVIFRSLHSLGSCSLELGSQIVSPCLMYAPDLACNPLAIQPPKSGTRFPLSLAVSVLSQLSSCIFVII